MVSGRVAHPLPDLGRACVAEGRGGAGAASGVGGRGGWWAGGAAIIHTCTTAPATVPHASCLPHSKHRPRPMEDICLPPSPHHVAASGRVGPLAQAQWPCGPMAQVATCCASARGGCLPWTRSAPLNAGSRAVGSAGGAGQATPGPPWPTRLPGVLGHAAPWPPHSHRLQAPSVLCQRGARHAPVRSINPARAAATHPPADLGSRRVLH